MLEIFVVLLDRLSLMVEYFLNCYSCSNAATCNMHAQFTAGENGNWFANFRTLATWISGLLATFVINLENFSVYFLHGCWCFSLKFGICGGNRNGIFQTESYYMLLPLDIYSRGVEAESIEDTPWFNIPWCFLMQMQVLPSRTHPLMQMSAFGGYILSGTKICSSS